MENRLVWAVVPAAGIGSRMQADRPKQYLELHNKLVIEHTLDRLASHPDIQGLIVAVAEQDPWWPRVRLPDKAETFSVIGGKQRADSVYNALQKLATLTQEDPWVLVHDAARPCIRHQDIDRMLDTLFEHKVGGILGVLVSDTVKRTDDQNNIVATVERNGLWRALTPQMFRLQQLIQVLKTAKIQNLNVTDEASAIELAGLKPVMIEGHADNIKITRPQDLALAALLMQQQSGEKR